VALPVSRRRNLVGPERKKPSGRRHGLAAFELTLSAHFRQEDPGAVQFGEWSRLERTKILQVRFKSLF
jgi:hypothetical protein